ncbi:MAG: helix-turn-helix domain-containing protein [Chloroflexota bacterium]
MDKAEGAGHERPRVGPVIRRWRNERGMTLSAMAAASGLNLGYLSQIENDKASPSLDALAAIAAALDVRIAWLLQDDAPPPRVVRLADRPVFEAPISPTAFGTIVDGGQARDLRIIEASCMPGTRTGLHAHPGDEHHLVLDGRWRMTQGEHVIEIGPGDYLSWDGSVPHDAECIEGDPGRILIFYRRRGS